MKRILFVDDEPRILEGLQGLLRKHRQKWDMAFALGAEAALVELEKARFDVIVTDMRMPKIDGAALLAQVHEKYPHMVRIILSGYTESEATLRAVLVAHQFIAKPCDAASLENAIERACALQSLISDDKVRAIVGRIKKLPSSPKIYAALLSKLCSPSATMADIGRLLQQDTAMCAKILQLVNSSFFGVGRRVANIENAVVYLGFSTIKNLVLTVEVFQNSQMSEKVLGFSIDALQQHALLTAGIAKRLLPNRQRAEDAFTAGLLHDIGLLMLASDRPDIAKIGQPKSIAAAEEEAIGHAEVGGYLLGLWGLPYSIVEAVANHHNPARVKQTGLDVLTAVHVADALAHEIAGDGGHPQIDSAYLEELGVAQQLDSWRVMANEQAAVAAAAVG